MSGEVPAIGYSFHSNGRYAQQGIPRSRLAGGRLLDDSADYRVVKMKIGGTESYPAVCQPFGGFADDIPIVAGHTSLPDTPGIGMERKADLFAALRAHLEFDRHRVETRLQLQAVLWNQYDLGSGNAALVECAEHPGALGQRTCFYPFQIAERSVGQRRQRSLNVGRRIGIAAQQTDFAQGELAGIQLAAGLLQADTQDNTAGAHSGYSHAARGRRTHGIDHQIEAVVGQRIFTRIVQIIHAGPGSGCLA